jgi:SAM-dependent methyltransferase
MRQNVDNPPRQTPTQVREHYEVERELAGRLRQAPKTQRRGLYSTLYDELYRRVPHHPQLHRKISPEQATHQLDSQMLLLRRFIHPQATVLEIGPGDCALSFRLAKLVRKVYGVDVSAEITKTLSPPQNFELRLSDGCSIPVPPGSIDVAYSNQLMEHLHPDDAREQLENIFTALAPGGVYVCITPSRLTGPHDVSKHFESVASGFHLKEYDISELASLFHDVGFRDMQHALVARGKVFVIPLGPARAFEHAISALPRALSKRLTRTSLVGQMLGVRLIARKPRSV